jgi:hypothetical protein
MILTESRLDYVPFTRLLRRRDNRLKEVGYSQSRFAEIAARRTLLLNLHNRAIGKGEIDMDATAKTARHSKEFAALLDCLVQDSTTENCGFLSLLTRRNSESSSAARYIHNKCCLNSCCHKGLADVKHTTSTYPALFCSKQCEDDTVRNMLQALSLQQCIDLQHHMSAAHPR